MRKNIKFLHPLDLVLIFYLLILTLVLIFSEKRPSSSVILISLNLIFMSCTILLAYLRQNIKLKILHFIFTVFPLLVSAYLYRETGQMVHTLFPHWFDYLIVNFETGLFGILPNLWLERFFSPPLTEILMFTYFIYLPMLPFLCIYFYFKLSPEALNQFLFPLISAYLICFLGFFLFPAESPRFFLEGGKELKGFIFRKIMLLIETDGQFQGGSFPSAHCAAGTVMIFLSYRYNKKLFALVCPVILLFSLATLYGRYHYLSDVVAGILIGFISIYLAKKLLS